MKQTTRNIGGPLLYSFMLACIFMALCAALYGAFSSARIGAFASIFLSYLLMPPFLGAICAAHGLALAYMLLVMLKKTATPLALPFVWHSDRRHDDTFLDAALV